MRIKLISNICLAIWAISSIAMALSLFYLQWFTAEVIALFSLAIWIFSLLLSWEPNEQIDKTNQLLENILEVLNSIQHHENHKEKWEKKIDNISKLSSKRDNLHLMKNITHRINRHTNTQKHKW